MPLRMEPLLAQLPEFATLFETGILVIDGREQFLVEPADMDLGHGDVKVTDLQVVEVQLLDFPLQLGFAPQEVVILA